MQLGGADRLDELVHCAIPLGATGEPLASMYRHDGLTMEDLITAGFDPVDYVVVR